MRSRPSALHVRDWLLIAALAGSWAVWVAGGIAEGLREQSPRLPMRVSSAGAPDAYPTIATGEHRARAEPPLRRGDRLVSVAGENLAGRSAVGFNLATMRVIRTQGFAPLEVERDGARFAVRLEATPQRLWWVPLPFSTALLSTAVLLLVLAPRWHLSRRFLWACWCFGLITARPLLGPGPTTSVDALIAFAFPVGAALTVWNAQEFTLSARPIPVGQRVLVFAVLALSATHSFVTAFVPFDARILGALLVVSNGLFAVATLAGMTRSYRHADPLERRQVRWILLGFFIGLLPLFANSVAVAVWGEAPLTQAVSSLAALAIPGGIFVSVIGYRWLDVDRLISAAASYALVGALVLAGALAITPRLASALGPRLDLHPQTAQLLLTLTLIGVAIPVHRMLRPRLDRRMFAARHERTLGFERLLEEIGRCAGVDELTRLPAERIDALLRPESIATYGREGAAFTPLFVRGRAAPAAFDAESLLVKTLERRFRPLAADARELDPFDRAALETLGVSVVVPMRRAERVAAFTCLGPKLSGDIYTPEELAYLAAVANRCSEVLQKLDDEVVIREARELQRSLRRYVPGAVAEELASGRALDTSEREISVMFVDIRGYSSFAERRAAEEIFSTVNAYTERVSETVGRHGGAIVEFNGDGLMAVFGAPRAMPDKERAAVVAARELVASFTGEIAIGVGIATGPAFVGNIRAADRWIWSAIGNTTNLAARLQELTRALDASIAVDATTHERAGSACAGFAHYPDVAIRGRGERRDIWIQRLP